MDKVKLTPEQLKELKYFIYKRGFREPEVMMEILDHFACKVEDKLTEKPDLDLQTAMKEAHTEFGYSGFYSIKASLDVFTRRRYKSVYWGEVKKIVTSIPQMILIIIVAYLTYYGMMWAYINDKKDFLFEDNVVSMTIWFGLIVAELIKGILLNWSRNQSYYVQSAHSITYVSILVFWVIFPSGKTTSDKGMFFKSVLAALSVIFFIINYIAHYKMMKAAHKDDEEFKAFNPNENSLL